MLQISTTTNQLTSFPTYLLELLVDVNPLNIPLKLLLAHTSAMTLHYFRNTRENTQGFYTEIQLKNMVQQILQMLIVD